MKGDEKPVAPHAKYVELLMGKFEFVTMNDTSEIYVFKNGCYRPHAEAIIRESVELALLEQDDSAHRGLVAEVLDAIRRRTYVSRNEFNPPGKLCLANGVLDLVSFQVGPHAINDRFTAQLPVRHDPSADCPRFHRFLDEVLPARKSRRIVQQLFGYCLQLGNPFQTAFLFVGKGENGKSVLMGALRDMLGSENVSTESFQRLAGENRFAVAHLWGKLANICPDIPTRSVRDTGVFKGLTGEDAVTGEMKFRNPFDFVNQAKLIFSANEPPEVHDQSFAFFRRWIMIEFPVSFSGRADRRLPEKLRAELPGILNWSLEGLRDLRDEGGFEVDANAEALKEDWRRRSDSLRWFVEECVLTDPAGDIAKEEFVRIYERFCQMKSVRTKDRGQVGRELPRLLPLVTEERPRRKGTRVLVWAGIRWSPRADLLVRDVRVVSPGYSLSLSRVRMERTGGKGEGGGMRVRSKHPDHPDRPDRSPKRRRDSRRRRP